MGVIKNPLREYPKDTRDLAALLRSLQIDVATDNIQDNAVGNSELRNSGPCSVIGRSANSTGDPADISASANNQLLIRRSNLLAFATLVDSDIPGTLARSADVATSIAGAIAALGLASGTYTPTLTNVANVGASTAHQCQYLRVGNTVHVSGAVDVDPTAAVDTQLGISLPIVSNFGAIEDCAGTAIATAVQRSAGIYADATNNRAELRFVAAETSNLTMFFTFTYQLI